MTYSESLFQRQLLKVLNRISNELHESNVLAKNSVEMQARMLQINEAASHQMSIEELKIMREADAMIDKRFNNLSDEWFGAESEDNKEQ